MKALDYRSEFSVLISTLLSVRKRILFQEDETSGNTRYLNAEVKKIKCGVCFKTDAVYTVSCGRNEYKTDRKLLCCKDALIGEALFVFTLQKDERHFLKVALPLLEGNIRLIYLRYLPQVGGVFMSV